jgi:hypothetical protein
MAEKKFLHDPRVRLAFASYVASKSEWPRVRDLLLPLGVDDFPPSLTQHFCHLLGIAHIFAGNFESAFQILSKAGCHVGSCDLESWLDLASFAVAGEQFAWSSRSQPIHRRLLAAISQAEASAKSDEYENVVKILDQLTLPRSELQSGARLVDAILKIHRPDSAPAHYASIVANYWSVLAAARRFPDDLPLPSTMRWTKDRLENVAKQGRPS